MWVSSRWAWILRWGPVALLLGAADPLIRWREDLHYWSIAVLLLVPWLVLVAFSAWKMSDVRWHGDHLLIRRRRQTWLVPIDDRIRLRYERGVLVPLPESRSFPRGMVLAYLAVVLFLILGSFLFGLRRQVFSLSWGRSELSPRGKVRFVTPLRPRFTGRGLPTGFACSSR